MRKLTKSLSIPMEVKKRVAERDSVDGWPCCVACGRPSPTKTAWSNAHFIPRSQLGRGVEENILTLCPDCHRKYDQTTARNPMRGFFREYLIGKYPGWNEETLYARR